MVLSSLLQSQNLDAIVVSTLIQIRYYTGFKGSNALLLVSKKGNILFTDPRYTTQAAQESNCPVTIVNGPLFKALAAKLKSLKAKRIGFEDTKISYTLYRGLAELAELVPLGDAIEKPRWVKSPQEIAAIRASVELNSQALDQAMKRFKIGMKEMDLASEIDYQMRKLGAEGNAFDTIVASGPHSALPHAHPRNVRIEAGSYLLIDMGACLNGYMSDMTRTFGVGGVPRKAIRIYKAVLEAQLAAIDAVRPGKLAGQVHAAAVKVLKNHGLDQFFIHSTGHGLGLEIHEAPRMGKKDKTPLETGMAITIEPGVYEPGFGGVRIEDTVLVTEKGVEVLTKTQKGWTIVG
ncbi:MAG: Xaa-Pro peptidase family protein [Acidobacteria bacterium]|nr:Xaa-Pro peptidase family protein [Acidobacteriota bacterium]